MIYRYIGRQRRRFVIRGVRVDLEPDQLIEVPDDIRMPEKYFVQELTLEELHELARLLVKLTKPRLTEVVREHVVLIQQDLDSFKQQTKEAVTALDERVQKLTEEGKQLKESLQKLQEELKQLTDGGELQPLLTHEERKKLRQLLRRFLM